MTSPAAVEAHPDGHSFNLSQRQKLEILGAILLALFLFALDQTVVGTALPIITTELNGQSLYTWAFTIYLLTSTISGPIYGKLSDLYGRRPIFIWAVSLFLAASVFAGLSQEMWQFILARGLQGLGGGAVFPIAFAIIADLYPPEERAKYGALFGAVFGLSSVLGPILGGGITDVFGWPWIFFINVPLGLISLFVCWRLLPPIKHPETGRNIDYVGAALFAAAIGPILLGLSNKRTLEWTDPLVGGLILLGLVIVAVFLWWESRAADPIVCEYGIRDEGPQARVADPGYLTFTLDNSALNSGGVAGYYSLFHASKRSGFDYNIPVRFSLKLSTDNAAMIAAAGHLKYLRREFSGMDLNADVELRLGEAGGRRSRRYV